MQALRNCLLGLSALFLCAGGAGAQSYPIKPIRLIVADAAGGAPDQLARIVAQAISGGLGPVFSYIVSKANWGHAEVGVARRMHR